MIPEGPSSGGLALQRPQTPPPVSSELRRPSTPIGVVERPKTPESIVQRPSTPDHSVKLPECSVSLERPTTPPVPFEEVDLPTKDRKKIEADSAEFPATLNELPTQDLGYIDWLSASYCAMNESIDIDDNEEEIESDVDETEEWEDGNLPVYTGAPLRLVESLVSILTLALTFSLSGQVIQGCPPSACCRKRFQEEFVPI